MILVLGGLRKLGIHFCFYIDTMNTLRPTLDHHTNIEGLEKEFGDSLSCPNCYPLCTQSIYRIQPTSSSLNECAGKKRWGIL